MGIFNLVLTLFNLVYTTTRSVANYAFHLTEPFMAGHFNCHCSATVWRKKIISDLAMSPEEFQQYL